MPLRGGRYETIGKIASGGMAQVLLGRTVGVGGFERLVAIKAMHEHLTSEPEFIAMFLDEARLAARIHHPNVVGTLDVDEDEGGVFIVMEYVEGPTLSGIQRAVRAVGKRVPIDVALRIFLDTLAGLHAAHELADPSGRPLNLVHRDVSPQNILVGVDGIARLTDFGVARAESRLSGTGAGQIKGKLAFMAPEQLSSRPIDRRADVYAAGVVLWEVLTGQRLLPGDNDVATITQILAGKRRSPREIEPSIPLELEHICMKALEPSADDRFPTAAAFAEAIESSGEPICSPRGVAMFVRELNLHQRPSLPAPSESRPNRASLSTGRHGGAGADPEASEASEARRAPPGAAGPSTVPMARTTGGFSVAPRRGSYLIALAAAIGGAGALAVFTLVRSPPVASPETRSPGQGSSSSSPASGSASASAPLARSAETPSAPPAPPAPPAPTSVAASASAVSAAPPPSGSSADPVLAINAREARGHARTGATPRASAAPATTAPATGSQPPTSSTSYRPGEL